MALLNQSGFSPKHIEEILRLPQDCWHKSWWYAIDANGSYTLPFLRQLRLLHYTDGTFTIQYKDFFEQIKPPCFSSLTQQVLITMKTQEQGFGDALRQINEQREALNLTQAILICNSLSELEAQAFIHQGISIYPAIDLVLPMQADCLQCGRNECPMNGIAESPIALCHGFLPTSEFV
jgi:bacterioferritin-associated ferredoxin